MHLQTMLGFIYRQRHLVKGSGTMQFRYGFRIYLEATEGCVVGVASRQGASAQVVMVGGSEKKDAFANYDLSVPSCIQNWSSRWYCLLTLLTDLAPCKPTPQQVPSMSIRHACLAMSSFRYRQQPCRIECPTAR